ncbi:ThiF family adenylyltransferase [Avibacterium sp. 20-15]|uniref:ThiF family adenylyltransferase n=1 Tax=unclassified Avibacterium TaxID=2685287 RepID=UPI002026C814|nr:MULTISPECIES: ThiF family adenylyltransferase [unclassified Avibacterium]MCW9732902.1 ThiF family adenylyltransferase [Avibacterium sp. 20-15]URL05037.1 ThiF family adenylyltransferase [Avibacterium sp. 20-132]
MKKMQLKKDVILKYSNSTCFLLYGNRLYSIDDLEKYYFNILANRVFDISILDDEIYDFLVGQDLVVPFYYNHLKNDRFCKNIYFFESLLSFTERKEFTPIDFYKDICCKRVLILGCGGIGQVIIKNLLNFGVKSFVLIDGDIIDISNLNRQGFFNRKDIGKSKVETVRSYICNHFDGIDVQVIKSYIEDVEIIKNICHKYSPDFIVNAADHPSNIRQMIFSVAQELDIPSIFGGVGIYSGFWGPICIKNMIYKDDIFSFNNSRFSEDIIEGSISTTNNIIGSFMSHDILKFWANPKDERLYLSKVISFDEYKVSLF